MVLLEGLLVVVGKPSSQGAGILQKEVEGGLLCRQLARRLLIARHEELIENALGSILGWNRTSLID